LRPVLGRLFTEPDYAPREGFVPVGILSHEFWTRRFNRNPSVIGKSLQVGNRRVTIVGVLPAQFTFLKDVALLVPAAQR
jgi:putative ABC transport system permease protein